MEQTVGKTDRGYFIEPPSGTLGFSYMTKVDWSNGRFVVWVDSLTDMTPNTSNPEFRSWSFEDYERLNRSVELARDCQIDFGYQPRDYLETEIFSLAWALSRIYEYIHRRAPRRIEDIWEFSLRGCEWSGRAEDYINQSGGIPCQCDYQTFREWFFDSPQVDLLVIERLTLLQLEVRHARLPIRRP